jgi:hypothetical protein
MIRSTVLPFSLVLLVAACGSLDRDPAAAPDGGSTGADGGAGADATANDAALPEGGSDGGAGDGAKGDAAVSPIACGATWCRAGQTCTRGVCTNACPSGAVMVPGQYPSLTAASTALVGTGGTICVTGAVSGLQGISYDRDLTIVGVSPSVARFDQVSINDRTVDGRTQPAKVHITGVSLTGLELVAYTHADTISLTASKVAGKLSGQAGAILISPGTNLTVSLDALDVECVGNTLGSCVGVLVSGGAAKRIAITNSWIHDSISGISLSDSFGGTIEIVNNTLTRNDAGINGNGRGQATITNNVFHACKTGQGGFSFAGISHHNLYWQFQYNSVAPDPQKGDVVADPLLDTSTPPGTGAGSACRGAGDPATASSVDHFGRVRGARPDIGALQAP